MARDDAMIFVESCLDIQHRHPWSDWPKRLPERIHGIRIHRIRLKDVPLEETDAYAIADFFEREPQWAGPRMPYHIVFPVSGPPQQALELELIGMHAKGHNSSTVGLAVVGDFTKHEPTRIQTEGLTQVCLALDAWIGGAAIDRHTSIGNYPKDCPGRHLDVEGLSRKLAENRQPISPEDAEKQLAEIGIRA